MRFWLAVIFVALNIFPLLKCSFLKKIYMYSVKIDIVVCTINKVIPLSK